MIKNDEKQKEIINMIISANINVNTEEHHNILYKLITLEQNEVAFTEKLLEILNDLKSFSAEFNNTQMLQILLYMKNYFMKIKEKPELKNIPNISNNINNIFIIYLSENLSENEEKVFCEINDSLFTILSNLGNAKDILNNIYSNIFAKVFENGKILKNSMVLKIINLFTSFSKIYLDYNNEQKELNFIFDYYNYLFGQCEIVSFNGNEQISNEALRNSATLFNKLIISFAKTSINTLESFVKNQLFSFTIQKNQMDEDLKNVFLDNESFLFFINHGFMLFSSCENYSNTNNQFFVVSNNNNQFNFLVSKGKGILIELLTLVCYKLDKINFIQKFTKFNLFLKETTEKLILHMVNYYKSNEYPREKMDNSNEEITQLTIIVKSLIYLETVIIHPESYNVIKQYQMDIFKYIIIPNLLITPLEKSSFELDSNLYSKTLFDMCKICDNTLPKNKALRLLMNMCERIDGFFNFIVYLYLKILLKLIPNDKIKDDTLIDDNNEIFVFLTKNINQIDLTEQCFQVLTSVSFLFSEREKIYDFFSEKIDLINHLLIKISNIYLKTKLCMFYSYILDDLFHNENEIISKSFNDSLSFLFNCVLNEEKNVTLFQVALNCVNSIILDKYLIQFCSTEVSIYANKVINYVQVNKMECFENDFNDFVKGIINYYMLDLEQDTIKLFDFFWVSFYNSIKYMLDKNGKKSVLGEKENNYDFSFKVNLIRSFINLIKKKNGEIKNSIFSKVIVLINELENFFNWEYENDILDILNLILEDTKYLSENYIEILKKYLLKFTKGTDGCFNFNFEEYHIYFIFSYLQCFNDQIIIKHNIKSNIFDMINIRIGTKQKKVQIAKIISEHIIYSNYINVAVMFFWDLLSNDEINIIIQIIINRMETTPNANLDLNVRLSLSIFLLFMNYKQYENIQNIDFYSLIVKVMNFFPLKCLSSTEQQIISIFCSLMVRLIIIQGYNFNNNKDKLEEILYHLIDLNFSQLKLIKKKLRKEMNEKTETKEQNNEEEEYIISREKEFTFTKRKEHKTSLTVDIKSEKYTDEDDYFADIKNENDDDSESSLNTGGNYSSKENNYMEDSEDDKDDDFIKIKKEQFNFNKYFKKFANESLKKYLKEINEFQMFDFMLKDIESNNKELYTFIMNKFDNETINLIENYRKFKKIVFNNNFLYRKIIKIKK